jgi:hypothetical protein
MPTLVEFGHDISGPTSRRPTNVEIGQRYFDTTLGVLLIWNGQAWVGPGGLTPVAPGNGAAAGTGNVASEQVGTVHKTVLTLTALSVTMTDATTAGNQGLQKIYDFPEGNILILGATTDLAIAAGVGGITDTAAVVGSIGSVAASNADATLTSTEANIVPSTSATLTGGVGAFGGQSTASAMLDGTATAVDAYLNFAVPDAGSTGNDTMSVTGTVTLVWVNLGDN